MLPSPVSCQLPRLQANTATEDRGNVYVFRETGSRHPYASKKNGCQAFLAPDSPHAPSHPKELALLFRWYGVHMRLNEIQEVGWFCKRWWEKWPGKQEAWALIPHLLLSPYATTQVKRMAGAKEAPDSFPRALGIYLTVSQGFLSIGTSLAGPWLQEAMSFPIKAQGPAELNIHHTNFENESKIGTCQRWASVCCGGTSLQQAFLTGDTQEHRREPEAFRLSARKWAQNAQKPWTENVEESEWFSMLAQPGWKLIFSLISRQASSPSQTHCARSLWPLKAMEALCWLLVSLCLEGKPRQEVVNSSESGMEPGGVCSQLLSMALNVQLISSLLCRS